MAFLEPPFSFWSHISLGFLEVAAAAAVPGNGILQEEREAAGQVSRVAQFGLPSLVPRLS